jgi:predicted phosphodiesterase
MRLHILSDLHLEFAPFAPPEVAADLLIAAGDIATGTEGLQWLRRAYPDRPIIYVLGNHEYYGERYPALLATLRAQAEGTNVHVLEQEAVTVSGVTILGCTLWTDFDLDGDPDEAMYQAEQQMSDYRAITIVADGRDARLRAAHTRAWHRVARAWLEAALGRRQGGPLVVVTHHVPCTRSIAPQYIGDVLNGAFASNLDELIAKSGARLWVHGHTHTAFDYVQGQMRVVCNPRGYPGEPSGFRAELVVEV